MTRRWAPGLPDTRTARFRVLAVATAAALASASCVVRRWHGVALTEVSVEREQLPQRRIRAHTRSGWVTLDVVGVAYPFVEGRAFEGPGEVILDQRVATAAYARAEVGLRRTLVIGRDSLVGRTVEFVTQQGTVALHVTSHEPPFVRGQPRRCLSERGETCSGLVRIDTRELDRLELAKVDAGTSIALTMLGVGATLGTLMLIVLLTKESCPFVYVQTPGGLQLAGEAYAGAAFRSLQRDDLLPLPSPEGGSPYRLVVRNEARETQYTDRAELLVVDHPPAVRVLSSHDGRLIRVGASQPARAVRDLEGRDRRREVAERDAQAWDADLTRTLASPAGPLRRGLVARFGEARPGVRPVLELVGANTPWLDLVFGRFFAAMGDDLARYQAAWGGPQAGPKLLAWKDREGVDLRVELRAGQRWLPVAVVPTVGPMALREIAVPLPVDGLAPGAGVEVRLSGGTGFWRLDSVRLSHEVEAPLAVRRLAPLAATAADGTDARPLLAATDAGYHVLSRIDEELVLVFERPPLAPGSARSLFFSSNGYYHVHPPVQGRSAPETVRVLQQEPGGLGRFSLELAADYRARAKAAPRLAESRR